MIIIAIDKTINHDDTWQSISEFFLYIESDIQTQKLPIRSIYNVLLPKLETHRLSGGMPTDYLEICEKI